MKNFCWISTLLFLTLAISACKGSKKTTRLETGSTDTVKKMILFDKPLDSLTTDYYDIDSVIIRNKVLQVFVNYSGGCGEVKFEMYYQPQKVLVMPHRASLFLKLTDNDPCRSVVAKKLEFDLSVLDKEAKAGGVILVLGNRKLTYEISDRATD